MMRRFVAVLGLALIVVLAGCERGETPTDVDTQRARADRQAPVAVNVVLDGQADREMLRELSRHGRVTGQIEEIDAVFLVGEQGALDAIRDLDFVRAAGLNAERSAGPPRPPLPIQDFAAGLNTWDLDAVNVTDLGGGRVPPFQQAGGFTGEGVYVGVLDTGLLDSWRHYFPVERIATEYARSFTGGGALNAGNVASQPNKWEHDVSGHGTHVTSTILGYNLDGVPINGVAPRATVIPVKVLNQGGFGWSAMIARGIVHIANLKAGPLSAHPVIINMSLGGPTLDPVEQAAIDFAIANGVIVVAAAGNFGDADDPADRGMAFPGAYPPVISAGAAGWIGEWGGAGSPTPDFSWWVTGDVPDPTSAADFYVTEFSSREMAGQDLDVVAPGSWVVGPFQLDLGHIGYFFLGGTSMASPHVAGIAALMAQKDGSLTAADAESILESTAVPLPAGSRTILNPDGSTRTVSWGTDATGSGIAVADAAVGAVP